MVEDLRFSTTGMAVDVLVSVAVGEGSVGVNVSVGITVGDTTVVAAGAGPSTGAADGSVQAVSRKIRVRKVVRNFFMSIYL